MSAIKDRLRAAEAKAEQENNEEIEQLLPEEDVEDDIARIIRNKPKSKSKSVIHQEEKPTTEEELEFYEVIMARREKAMLRKALIKERSLGIALSIACAYLIFLIYGVFCTKYAYDESGKIQPQIMSVSEIRECKQFEVLLSKYLRCRNLYEEVLVLDYRLGQGVESPLIIAPEYEKLLEDVEDLSIKIDAISIDTKYVQIKSMLLAWVKTDLAVYLQKMSSAISQNNPDDANIALSYQIACYNDFSIITQNIVTMGSSIVGVDVTDERKWSPEKYIDEYINGK